MTKEDVLYMTRKLLGEYGGLIAIVEKSKYLYTGGHGEDLQLVGQTTVEKEI